jgi:hypothetical protein
MSLSQVPLLHVSNCPHSMYNKADGYEAESAVIVPPPPPINPSVRVR